LRRGWAAVIALANASRRSSFALVRHRVPQWSQREIDGKITNETRFYITSLVLLANAGWDLHPLESAAFPRRTPKAAVNAHYPA